jgi:hypothetical protein
MRDVYQTDVLLTLFHRPYPQGETDGGWMGPGRAYPSARPRMNSVTQPRIDAMIAPLSPPGRSSPFGVSMRLPFCILNVLGDVLDDGELSFLEAAQSLDAAKARVQSLAESWPGEYVIYDEATGERVLITAASSTSAKSRER